MPHLPAASALQRFQDGFAREGTDVTLSSSSEQFASFLNEDAKFWFKLVKDAGVKLE